ncbi:hypothetical protein AAES_150372 [Amazona aestiva]|uniref:Uncharacterized protein n=1 Tax=Amazona aestiva TaxID=12930 RepID=A0A0Q3QPW9_AMAAE|nr:hypothetical protein AAES_150372 [Amazona aestiva]
MGPLARQGQAVGSRDLWSKVMSGTEQWEVEGNGCGYKWISEGMEAERECKLELISWCHFACSYASNE